MFLSLISVSLSILSLSVKSIKYRVRIAHTFLGILNVM